MKFFRSRTLSTQTKGSLGEELAEKYLLKHGFKILEKNFRCRVGEIDLIATQRSIFYFIEVKFRKSHTFGSTAEAISIQKQKRMTKTILLYLQQHALFEKEIRLAAILIDASENIDTKNKIEWIEFPLEFSSKYY